MNMSHHGPRNAATLDTDADVLNQVAELEQRLAALRTNLLTSTPRRASEAVDITAARIRRLLKARRARETIFGANLFADPAWDILLEAYAAQMAGQQTSVTALSNAAAVPPTTALRWLRKLEDEQLLQRRADDEDGRRSWMELTPLGAAKMRRYLESVSINLPL